MKKYFIPNKLLKSLIKLVILFSFVCLTVTISSFGNLKLSYIGIFLSFVICLFAIFKFKILEKIFYNYNFKLLIVCFIFSFFVCLELKQHFPYSYALSIENFFLKLPILKNHYSGLRLLSVYFISFFSIFALTCSLYVLYFQLVKILKPIILDMKKQDIIFFISFTAFFFLLSTILFSFTNIFYSGYGEELFSADCGLLTNNNAFINFTHNENDIRQPLFSLFAIPLCIPAYTISCLFSFIPKIYYYLLIYTNSLILCLFIIITVKLLKITSNISKIFIYILFSCLFSTILFGLLIEQYVVACFYLIVCIYSYINEKNTAYSFFASTGTLTTSGIIFPVLIKKEHSLLTNIKNLLLYATSFVCLIIVFGKFGYVLDFNHLKFLMSFSGEKLSLINKILQYINFIPSIIISPKISVSNGLLNMKQVNSINILGIILLLIFFISCIFNKNNKFIKTCFLWIIFSFLLLGLFGWGTAENILVLYSLYFSWAFISPIVLLIEKIPKNFALVKYFLYSAIILSILTINLIGFIDIIKFAITNFPA